MSNNEMENTQAKADEGRAGSKNGTRELYLIVLEPCVVGVLRDSEHQPDSKCSHKGVVCRDIT